MAVGDLDVGVFLAESEAAVGVGAVAGDAAGPVGREIHVAPGVIRPGQRHLQRRPRGQLLGAVRGVIQAGVGQPQAAQAPQIGVQRAARRHPVDPDSWREFVCQRGHQPADRELRRHIQRPAAARIKRRRRLGQHDRGRVLGLQRGQRRLHRLQVAEHIGVKHLVERAGKLVGVEVGEAAVEVEHADAADQGVQAAVGVDGRRDRPLVGVAGGGVAGHHRHVELGDERLEVQRFAVVGDPLGGHDGALNDQQVDAGGHQRRRQRLGVLRADPHRRGHPGFPDAGHRGTEQVGVQRRGVQLLQQPDRRRRFGFLGGRLDDLRDLGLDVGVPPDQALAVEYTEAAEPAQFDGELRRHQRVGGVCDDRDLEPVGVQLPGRGHVLRGPGAP
ncbi:hypothetical protein C1Y40_04041 [Mycobacterium talmoniae]|uniref:Uncharacterized protein n=1 Tax=Mycobacterium talmoniae TaxID=1858794 RepID=A0A2S8BGJ0_9MYCO|nr:hypothetical protein C1Y40_04041 [Mycobacterium talmoniae]